MQIQCKHTHSGEAGWLGVTTDSSKAVGQAVNSTGVDYSRPPPLLRITILRELDKGR